MEKPGPTTTDHPDLPPIQDLPANEYRQVRDGKTVAEVVAARPEPPADSGIPPPEPAGAQLSRDEAGRFVPKAAGDAKTETPVASKAGNPRHDPKARVEELKTEIAALAKEKGETKAERDQIAGELATLRAERDALKAPAGNGNGHASGDRKAESTPTKLEYPAELKTFDAYADKNPDASYEEYMDARGDFRIDERDKKRRADEVDQTARTEYENAHRPFWEREKAFKVITPDYDAVIQRSPIRDLTLPVEILTEMRTAADGPALRYYLSQHPKETQQIASMSGAAAVDYLRLLVPAALGDPTVTPSGAPKTKADPPFETVGASAAASTQSLETVAASGSAADYRRLRRQS